MLATRTYPSGRYLPISPHISSTSPYISLHLPYISYVPERQARTVRGRGRGRVVFVLGLVLGLC